MRRTFVISFWGVDGEREKYTRTFEDTQSVTAREYAEDFGYCISHKAECHIEEITNGQ